MTVYIVVGSVVGDRHPEVADDAPESNQRHEREEESHQRRSATTASHSDGTHCIIFCLMGGLE
jgi:hypothetical protein